MLGSLAWAAKTFSRPLHRLRNGIPEPWTTAGSCCLPRSAGKVKRLTPHVDHRGGLTALLDVRDPFWDEQVVYAYEFTILPGRIKGWAMHEKQADLYFASTGNVRVVLFDGRQDSPSAGSVVELHFSELSPGLVSIPPGVWHADHNWGTTKAPADQLPPRVRTTPTTPTSSASIPAQGHPVRLGAARRLMTRSSSA